MAEGPGDDRGGLGPGGADDSSDAIRAALESTRAELAQHLAALKNKLFHPHHPIATAGAETAMPSQKSSRRTPSSSSKKGKAASAKKVTKRASGTASHKAPKGKAKAKGAGARKAAAEKARPKKAVAARAAAEKSRPKTPTGAKAGGAKARKKATAPKRGKRPTVLEQAGEVLDTVLAGAMVGAVTGAAQKLGDEPTAVSSQGEPSPPAPASQETPSTTEVLSEMAPGAAAGAIAGAAKAVMPAEEKKNKRRKS